MDFPKTDNCCTRLGWIEKIVWVPASASGGDELHVSHKPEADLEGSVWCFCHAEQDMILIVNGCFCDWEEIED